MSGRFQTSTPKDEALLAAAAAGDIGAVTGALGAGANIDAHDSLGGSALCVAASAEHLAIVRLLLDRKADPTLIAGASIADSY